MADYQTMFDNRWLGHWDLSDDNGNKRDLTLTIARVEAQVVTSQSGKEDKKPILHFEPVGNYHPKPMICNKTNCATIRDMYSTRETKQWVGKRITLYATTTSVGGKTTDCIRIRPTVPKDRKESAA